MKVIDFLNKIARVEEGYTEDIPKKIKYCDEIYKMTKVLKDNGEYWYNYIDKYTTCLLFDNSELNNEIEIIEDTPKEDKKIDKLNEHYAFDVSENVVKGWTQNERIILDKLNEIIDRLNGEDNDN